VLCVIKAAWNLWIKGIVKKRKMSLQENLIIELLKFVPTLLIGLVTMYIAYRQHHIEKVKLDKDLFKERSEVYKAIDFTEFQLVGKNSVSEKMLHTLSFGISNRNFVFSELLNNKITSWIMSIWELRELERNNKKEDLNKKIEIVIRKANKIKEEISQETRLNYKKKNVSN